MNDLAEETVDPVAECLTTFLSSCIDELEMEFLHGQDNVVVTIDEKFIMHPLLPNIYAFLTYLYCVPPMRFQGADEPDCYWLEGDANNYYRDLDYLFARIFYVSKIETRVVLRRGYPKFRMLIRLVSQTINAEPFSALINAQLQIPPQCICLS